MSCHAHNTVINILYNLWTNIFQTQNIEGNTNTKPSHVRTIHYNNEVGKVSSRYKNPRKSVVRNVGTNIKETSKSTQMPARRCALCPWEEKLILPSLSAITWADIPCIFIHYADALQFFSPLTRTGRAFVTKQEQPSTHFSWPRSDGWRENIAKSGIFRNSANKTFLEIVTS